MEISHDERARAEQNGASLQERLRKELLPEGSDADTADQTVQDDCLDHADSISETGCAIQSPSKHLQVLVTCLCRHMGTPNKLLWLRRASFNSGCCTSAGTVEVATDVMLDRYKGEDGEMKRPWCPATRVLEHREMHRVNAEAEERRRASQAKFFGDPYPAKPYRHDFPPLQACAPLLYNMQLLAPSPCPRALRKGKCP